MPSEPGASDEVTTTICPKYQGPHSPALDSWISTDLVQVALRFRSQGTVALNGGGPQLGLTQTALVFGFP